MDMAGGASVACVIQIYVIPTQKWRKVYTSSIPSVWLVCAANNPPPKSSVSYSVSEKQTVINFTGLGFTWIWELR